MTLVLERTKYTQVWLDGRPCGENPILCTPQEYALGQIERQSRQAVECLERDEAIVLANANPADPEGISRGCPR